MAAKKPVRAPRSAPARTTSRPAAAPPAPAPDGMVVLVYRGGADLSFRDRSGAKRRVLRGVPFTVDAATAELLLATDPTVGPADLEPEPAPVTDLATGTPVAPVPAVEPAPVAPAEPVTPPPPSAPSPAPGPGAITLGDLPPSARIGRP